MSKILWLAACAAGVAVSSSPASAQTAREQELEERLRALEESVATLRKELEAERAARAAAPAQAPQVVAQAPPPPPLTTPPQTTPAPPADGFRVGGTTLALNGSVKTNVLFSSFSGGEVPGNTFLRDFYLPQAIPVGGATGAEYFDFHAKQTRLWVTTTTPIGGSFLRGHIEFDFQSAPGLQGSERTTNAYNLALRRAFVTLDDWLLIGQDWSTFQNVAVLPESTDFIGPTEGTVFEREPQIRITQRLSDKVTLAVAVENSETSSITSTSTALLENDDDQVPDVAARLNASMPFGDFSLAGVVRQLRVQNGAAAGEAFGYGLSFAGRIPFGPEKRHDVRFMISGGDGIGRYIGLNFAPDAVFAGGDLEPVGVLAGFASLRIGWTPRLRSTFTGSFQEVDYASLVPLTASEGAWSLAGNLFFSPWRNLDLGIEYRHGLRRLLNGQEGELDRIETTARYNF